MSNFSCHDFPSIQIEPALTILALTRTPFILSGYFHLFTFFVHRMNSLDLSISSMSVLQPIFYSHTPPLHTSRLTGEVKNELMKTAAGLLEKAKLRHSKIRSEGLSWITKNSKNFDGKDDVYRTENRYKALCENGIKELEKALQVKLKIMNA